MNRYFLYCRKSSEAEDRQVLSIQSQTAELQALAKKLNGEIVEVFSESQSAKEPGRPIFGEMIRRLMHHEADAILCWKLDRLARNPIDGGTVIWAVNHHGIKVVTPTQTFQKEDETVILMWVELGMAHKFVIDLGKNSKRGMKTKAEMGWFPGYAPIGYKNERLISGLAVISQDTERFQLVRRMWDLLLTGHYSVQQVLEIASRDWGLQTRTGWKRPGKAFARSGIYKMFSNPFYSGEFEFPGGSGNWHKGAHVPMVTKEEFERVQIIQGRSDRPRPKKHQFAFTGVMRCADCGTMITAEEKWKRQKNGKEHHYIYYHCTKKRNPNCTQGSIEEQKLIEQIVPVLTDLEISPLFVEWALKHIDQIRDSETTVETLATATLDKRFNEIDSAVREITKMRYQLLIGDEEFERERGSLKAEQATLERAIQIASESSSRWRDPARHIYKMAESLQERFTEGGQAMQKELLSEVGSNLTVKDRKLIFEAKEPFRLIQKHYIEARKELDGLEPPQNGSLPMQIPQFANAFRIWCRSVDEVRTYFMKQDEERLRKLVSGDPISKKSTALLHRIKRKRIRKAA